MRSITLAILFATSVAFSQAKAQQNLKTEADALYRLSEKLDGSKLDSLKLLSARISQLSTQAGYDRGIIRANLVGAIYAINRLKLDSSDMLLNACDQLINTNPNLKNSNEQGSLYYYRGQVAFRRMQLDESDSIGKRALAIFVANNNLDMMGSTYVQFGTVEILRGNQIRALSHYMKAYKLKLESGVPAWKSVRVLEQIGGCYSVMGQHEKSLEYFRKAQKVYMERSPDHLVLASIYYSIAKAKSQMSENDSALYYFNMGRRIAEKHNNKIVVSMINSSSAEMLSGMQRFAESNALIVPMLTRAGHLRFAPMGASVLVTIATNYFHLKKYDSALMIAKHGYAISKSDNGKQSLFAKIIADVYETRGMTDSAFYYLKKHTSAFNFVYNLENQKKFSTVYAEIETLSKQNEIDLLEKQNALDNAEKKFLIWGSAFSGVIFLLIIMTLRLQYHNNKKAHAVEKLNLQKELELKEKDLHTQALKMIYLNNGITEIETSLKKLQSGSEGTQVQQLLSAIHTNKSLEKEWNNFDKYFSGVHADFYEKINTRYENLSISETRLAGLIRMNLTNSEIASILNIESNSVKMAKYRLKKKIGLTDDEDIHTFIQRL